MRDVKFVSILFLLALLISSAFCKSNNETNLTIDDITLYDITDEPRTFPIDILVSNELNSEKNEAVAQALNDWQKFSNGLITFNVTYNWVPTEPFSEYVHNEKYPITVWYKKNDDPILFQLQMRYSFVATGFSDGNYIVMVEHADCMSYRDAYVIFKHEFGHVIGMEHIKKEYPALMNLKANKGALSKYDDIMLCGIYDCKI